jgi:uncharacterized delta-60 repeat protein
LPRLGTIQADGKILVFDQEDLSRYNPDGTPDLSFGNNGSVLISSLTGVPVSNITALTVQSDGKILFAAGKDSSLRIEVPAVEPSVLLRLNADGSPDPAFINNAKATSLSEGVGSTLISAQSDGTIYALRDNQWIHYQNDGTFISSQTLATSYGGLYGPRGAYDSGSKFATMQADNKLVIADYKTLASGQPPSAVTNVLIVKRYNIDGSLDNTFGDNGLLRANGDFRPTQIGIDLNGKIVVSGASQYETLLTRYNSNGTIDDGFGTQGILRTGLIDPNYNNHQNGLLFQPDGKIVLAGKAMSLVPSPISPLFNSYIGKEPLLERYNNDGSLDLSFGTGGKAVVANSAHILSLQADGSILGIGGDGVANAILTSYDSLGGGGVGTGGSDNHAPVVVNGITAQAATEDSPFTLAIPANTFNDIDPGDALTYIATLANGNVLPAWLSFNGNNQTLSGTPIAGNAGDLAVRITATDRAGAKVSSDFNLGIGSHLVGNGRSNTLVGTANNDKIEGLNGADSLDGGIGNDTIDGGNGNDSLWGGQDNDVLLGGSGQDYLTGAEGNDVLTGGLGNDRFIFSGGSIGQDTITDFVAGQDKIALSKATFGAITSGVGGAIGSNFVSVADDGSVDTQAAGIVFSQASGKLFYNQNGIVAGLGANGGDFATLTGVADLAARSLVITS